MKVRDKLPKRRLTPTKSPTGTNWSEHKPDLKEDFHSHCAYCGSFDGFRHTYFEVDHFIPKSFFEKNGNITYCQYDNLVYSCKFCNNKKLSKWPSQREDIYHVNDEGFIEPCDIEFDEHLYRTKDGGILWKTKLGEWMVKKAFSFDERDYSIKLLWELNQLRKLVESMTKVLRKMNKADAGYRDLESKTKDFALQYFVYHQELMEYYDSL